MATLFSNLSSGSNPTMLYTVTANETSRAATSVTFSVTVQARLEDQTYGYFSAHVYPKIKMGGTTVSFDSLGTFPRGAGTKSSTKTVTVTGLSSSTKSVSYTFSATSELGGTSSSTTGYVGGKSGTVSISAYATAPSLSGSVTIKDGSTVVSSYFRENIGSGSFSLSWPSQSGGNGTIRYELERSVNGGSYVDVNNSLTSTSTTHAPGSVDVIRYRVRAKNTVGTDVLYSGWIYSPSVKKNELTPPSLSSGATVTYNTNTLTLSLGASTDNLGRSISYTLTHKSGSKTTLNGSGGSVSPGSITVNTNNGTSGFYITLANLKTAALGSTTHSDTNPYKGVLEFTVTANNGYSTKSTNVSVPLDLGKDAPVSGTPSVSIASSSYFVINSTNVAFPEYKPITLTIPANVQDVLGRNCSFDIVIKEGTTEKAIKNTGIITSTSGTTATVNNVEAGLLTAKKTVSFYVKAKTYNGVTKSSTATPNQDLHYYKKPTVTSSSLSRVSGSASFVTKITANTSLGGSTNTSTMPSGWTKGTSTTSGSTETYTVSRSGLADSYSAKISLVIRDSIGFILKGDGSNDVTMPVTIPSFSPMLSIREKGVGINAFATDAEMLKVGGNITLANNGTIKTRGVYGNSMDASMLYDHLNGNVTLSALGADLYIGYTNTSRVRLWSGLWDKNVTQEIISNTGDFRAKNKVTANEYWLKDDTNSDRKFMSSYKNDANGYGLSIGAGWETVIGGGEGDTTYQANATGQMEQIVLASDNSIKLFTNIQQGWASNKEWKFGTDGIITMPRYKYPHGYNMAAVRDPSGAHDDTMLIQNVQETATFTGGEGYADITFGVQFAAAPVWILATPINAKSLDYTAAVYNATTTGCRVYMKNINGVGGTTSVSIGVQVVACGRK
ncbi:hypothetical protein COJ01_17065 [Priestia megaterium]|uniref:hypothetical protein n=1 Tax=Priestia megaterium TaxID=1404 RepID=UPI000BFA0049|nr:hypothetical protein [Priestia megaterium]PFK99782.1 hypothetical protein COJ01_17065 [Priestia megaterium]